MFSSPRSSCRMGKNPSIGFLSNVLHLCTHNPANNPTCTTPSTTHPHSHPDRHWKARTHSNSYSRSLAWEETGHPLSLQVIHVRSALILFWWIAQIRRTRTLCEWMCVCSLINIPLKTNQNKPEASEVRVLLSCWSVSRRCTYLLLGVVECVGGWLFSRVFVPGFCTVSHYVM